MQTFLTVDTAGLSKGDLFVYDGDDLIRFAVSGSNGDLLSVDSSTASGLAWATPSSGGTIPDPATATPADLGTAAVGTGTKYAREDHVHNMPSAGDVGADPAGTASSAVSTHEAAADPHPDYALESSLAAIATSGAWSDLSGVPAGLSDIGALSSADGNFIVGSAGGWVAESGATARTSLGLGTSDSPTFDGLIVGDGSGTTKTIEFANATDNANLSWNVTGAYTLTLPNETGTIATQEYVSSDVDNRRGTLINEETFDTAGWSANWSNSGWTRTNSATPSSNTGPSGPFEGSHYIFVEASSASAWDQATLTKTFNLSAHSQAFLRFAYHMYFDGDVDGGVLEVIVDNEKVWGRRGDQGDLWREALIDLSKFCGGSSVTVIFRFNVGYNLSTFHNDCALDHIRLYGNGREPAEPESPSLPAMVLKPANTSRTGTTMSADPHLVLPLRANTKYVFEGLLIFTGLSSADARFWLQGPTGMEYDLAAPAQSQFVTDESAPFPRSVPLSGTSSKVGVPIRGIIVTGATAGDLTVEWSQLASSGTPTILYQNSYLRLTSVSQE